MKKLLVLAVALFCVTSYLGKAEAVLLTDPNDARVWQGANVGTFAQLLFGSNTPANRQLVIDNQVLDDGIFDPTGFIAGTLMSTSWATGGGGGCLGQSLDSTGTGSFAYSCGGLNLFTHANSIDDLWFQSSGTIGQTVYDLGFDATKAAVFNTIDHGPLPQEAIESTVYLSNDLTNWTQAVVERVWLEGFKTNTGILWDGFAFAVGTGTSSTFRYASIIHGGPGAFYNDGDDEINGIMGLRGNFTGNPGEPGVVPEPTSLLLLGSGLVGFVTRRKVRA